MSKPRNKTSLKVGDMVYHPFCGTHRVVELSPLSNRICYVVVEQDNERIECACENSKAMTVLKPLDEYMTSSFYLSSEEAKREEVRRDRYDRHSEIGYAVEQIFRKLPWSSKGGAI